MPVDAFNPTLNNVKNEAYRCSREHGWYDVSDVNIPEKLALIHSEVSEALEEFRSGRPVSLVYTDSNGKPEGFGIELADAIIRIADLCGFLGLDLDYLVLEKMRYNESRPYRHGGKAC